MKLCSICKVRPVGSPRGKYCAECRAKLKNKKAAEPVRTGCDGCPYWRDCGNGSKACHLTIDTGEVRTGSREECYALRCK